MTKLLNAPHDHQRNSKIVNAKKANDSNRGVNVEKAHDVKHRAIGTEQSLFTIHPSSPGAPHDHQRHSKKVNAKLANDSKEGVNVKKAHDVDHRAIGTEQSLFTTHPSSPGAPFFQPDGTHIFQKLISFLRAQYPHYGFREVLTPTMYKETLWEQSGHWQNYKDDMFTVKGNSSRKSQQASQDPMSGRMQPKESLEGSPELEEYGLKPMNCPGHCLLYKSERRSYRDLPIRYAEFSPLHRNEISGALSGLTRVRRFHQDDGHIFCRPNQVRQEIDQSLAFIRMVYKTLDLADYRIVLSTRPQRDYIGSVKEWDRAEEQLKAALNENFGSDWKTENGEGAFYGPKIDLILRDGDGKEHQTGTIQLDFQLPKRFELSYESPAPEMEAEGENWGDSEQRVTLGKSTPVMIHRAILGSLERFMALLLERCEGKVPFWLSPKQMIILTVGKEDFVKAYANKAKDYISNDPRDSIEQDSGLPRTLIPPLCLIDIDDSADSIAQKIVRAKKKRYNLICVVGARNVGKGRESEDTLDLDVTGQPNQRRTWDLIESIKRGSQAPLQRDRGTGAAFHGLPGVRLNLTQCGVFVRKLNYQYH